MTEEIRVLKRFEVFVLGKCRYGCGIDIEIRNIRGFLKRYKHGHNILRDQYGDNNVMWNGGINHVTHGYIKIKNRNHNFTDINGYVLEHRLVYEEFYNCCLLPYTQIHHKNHNRQDNRIENLEPVYHSQHRSRHKKDMDDRYCLKCGSKETHCHKNGRINWFKFKDGFMCRTCYIKDYSKIYYKLKRGK